MSEISNSTPSSIDDGIPEVTFTMEVSQVVQSPVDTTLSISGMAADALATGQAIEAAKDELQAEIDNLETDIDEIADALFPVGCIYITTSATAPGIGAENWNWQEILIPVTQGDLMDGPRSYADKGENDTAGTMHFWRRLANTEVSA